VDWELKPELVQRAREALREVALAEEICRRGTAAGYDMAALQAPCTYYRDRLQAILQEFAPKRIE
jgi:hypothetical protein